MAEKYINSKSLFSELTTYLLVQLFGLFSAKRILGLPDIKEQITSQEPISFWQIIIAIALATLFILVFLRIFKKGTFYKIFFGILFFLGSFFTLNIWLPALPSLVLTILLFYLYQHFSYIIFHNLIIVLTIIWAAILLGLTIPGWQIVIILLILSVYDMIAVWKTKHMVKMFTGLAQKGVILALVMPARSRFLLQKVPDFKPHPDDLRQKFLFMGTGDFVLPMVLAVSVLLENIWGSILIIIGALFGLVFIHFVFLKKQRRPLPALPPLAGGAIIGWLISKICYII